MASLYASQMPRLLTVEEFLRIDFGPDLRAELDNGFIRMMAGGTRDHARVQMNLYRFLGTVLRGSGCRPYGSDMGVRSADLSLRYPDVTVDCGAANDGGGDTVLHAPRVIVEVLSPGTREYDLRDKLPEYRQLSGVDTIAFIDPEKETLSVHQRIANGWTESLFAVGDLDLPSLGITVPHAEIFARD